MAAIRPLPIYINPTPQPATPPAPVSPPTSVLPATTATSGGGSTKKTTTLFQQFFGIDPASAIFAVVGVILVVVGLVMLLAPVARQAGEQTIAASGKVAGVASKVAAAAA